MPGDPSAIASDRSEKTSVAFVDRGGAADASSNASASLVTRVLLHPVFLCAMLGVAIRWTLALRTVGTNDVLYWQRFMETIAEHGSVEIYRRIWFYNHPPMMSGYLSLIRPLVPYSPNGFPFLMKLPALLADLGSIWLIYRIVVRFWDARSATLAACLVALSPILISVSGFHGNTDPLFIFLVVLAAERLAVGRNPILAGAILGVATNVKIVPVLTWPLFFFWIPTWRDRFRFFIPAGAIFAGGFAYHLWFAFADVKRNVFDYPSHTGLWGVTLVLRELGAEQLYALYARVGRWVMLLAMIGVGVVTGLRRSGDPAHDGRLLFTGLGNTFLAFFLLTPGFGIQYLAWLVPTGVFLGLRGALAYNVVGGAFVIGVYTFWSQGFPWYLADSDRVGLWRGPNAALCFAVWICLVLWAWGIPNVRWDERRSLG